MDPFEEVMKPLVLSAGGEAKKRRLDEVEAVLFSVPNETSKNLLLLNGEVFLGLFDGQSELVLIAGMQQLAEEV